jgi:hypothetical protein
MGGIATLMTAAENPGITSPIVLVVPRMKRDGMIHISFF